MKKYIKGILATLAIILVAFSANAKGVKGEPITNKGYDYVVNPENANVTLYPGMTCGEWTKVLRRFCKSSFGLTLEEVRNGSTVADKATGSNFYNTHLLNGKAGSFGPVKVINKNVFVYNSQPWLVMQCAQMISTDQGLINNAINGNADLTPEKEKVTTPNDECKDCKKSSNCDQSCDIDSLYRKDYERLKKSVDDMREIKKKLRQDDLDAIDNAKIAAEKMGYQKPDQDSNYHMLILLVCLIILAIVLLNFFILNRSKNRTQPPAQNQDS